MQEKNEVKSVFTQLDINFASSLVEKILDGEHEAINEFFTFARKKAQSSIDEEFSAWYLLIKCDLDAVKINKLLELIRNFRCYEDFIENSLIDNTYIKFIDLLARSNIIGQYLIANKYNIDQILNIATKSKELSIFDKFFVLTGLLLNLEEELNEAKQQYRQTLEAIGIKVDGQPFKIQMSLAVNTFADKIFEEATLIEKNTAPIKRTLYEYKHYLKKKYNLNSTKPSQNNETNLPKYLLLKEAKLAVVTRLIEEMEKPDTNLADKISNFHALLEKSTNLDNGEHIKYKDILSLHSDETENLFFKFIYELLNKLPFIHIKSQGGKVVENLEKQLKILEPKLDEQFFVNNTVNSNNKNMAVVTLFKFGKLRILNTFTQNIPDNNISTNSCNF